MNSLLSIFFGRNCGTEVEEYGTSPMAPFQGMLLEEQSSRKRGHGDAATTTCSGLVPKLVPAPGEDDDNGVDRRLKRFRGEARSVSTVSLEDCTEIVQIRKKEPTKVPQSLLQTLPDDVIAHCLSFLGSVEDRFALQCTSKQFRRISNSEEMLLKVAVGGDKRTGLHGIIRESDTPESASDRLSPYTEAGNLEAIYMLGIIKSYCHKDVKEGLNLLKYAAAKGYIRASYALGLALRDSEPKTASKFMKAAADQAYIPALQELLPPRQMKDIYGEPKAEELRLHLDPFCLNRLLTRFYVESAELRDLNTSHCWNPLCGRWAFKANMQSPSSHTNHPMDVAIAGGASFSPSRTSNRAHTLPEPTAKDEELDVRVSRMKMCSRCCRAKYCSKLCQVYDWRSGRHKMECQFL